MRRCTAMSIVAALMSLSAGAMGKAPDLDGPWTLLDVMPGAVQAQEAWIRPQAFKAVQLDDQEMRRVLANVPMETFPFPPDEGVLFLLPHPDGGFATFRLVESPVMEPGLMAQFPDIKTYRGQGVDDPAANVRLDMTPQGFHAMVLSPEGDYFIDPYSKGDVNHYAVYYKHNYLRMPFHEFTCHTQGEFPLSEVGYSERNSGGTLKTYRTAVAATGEYTTFHGGTVALGQAAIVTAINRVTAVYERDVCIRLVLVANNSSLVYTNSATDPYTNNNGSTMLGQNQTNITSIIGSANYDIGHVFSTGGGGVAQLGCVCSSANKSRGVTGSAAPINDPFTIDYVAHEMGHQFGANHTFNGTGGSCAGNRASTAAYEPGSASTIMGYAGICGAADDLQSNSDAIFHHQSYAEIRAFVAGGGSCGANSATGNTVPTVAGGVDFTIPTGTAFTLTTASASDANGDALTYSWEERDLGAAQTATTADNGTSPIMRCWNATTSNSRTFPRYTDVLDGGLSIGEQYPAFARTFKTRVNVRDNRSGGGGVIEDDVNVTIVNTSAAFAITAPNTNVSWSGTQTVTWNVSGTNAAPINTANVRILLSTDGGISWAYTLAASTPNDGSEAVTVPSISSTTARIRVEAVGNIYFDVSNVNFTLVGSPPPSTPTGVSASPNSICGSAPVTLAGTVPSGQEIDWYSGSCGGTFVGTGPSLVVTPVATTSYFARARNTTTGAVSTTCASATVTLLAGSPSIPTNVTAADGATCSATSVIWTAAVGASSYQVLRNLANDVNTATQIGTSTASPYSDSTGIAGQPYFYWVRSVGGCGASGPSNGDSGYRRGAPALVSNVVASDGTAACGSIVVTWTTVAGATGYQLFRNSVNDPNTATQVAATASGTATDFPPANTTFFYWVRGSNTCAASGLAGGDTGFALATPAAPTNISASDSVSCSGVGLTWTSVAGASSYQIVRSTTNNSASGVTIGSAATNAYTDSTAVAGTPYFYWVSASNTCGTSALGGHDAGARLGTPGVATNVAAADGTSCGGVLV
ncbi:MAG: M12 family metallo-peptidase, partial [Planctomycetota bacterium]|nr:M12 family metallo-peptidase [Planctomycetota bacterium]